MSDATPQIAKIKLKVGTMELEYQGDPAFLTGGIEALLETMGALSSKVPERPLPEAAPSNPEPSVDAQVQRSSSGFTFSTNTIAAHIGANSGPELAICAMAALELVQRNASSSRTEILTEMKSATSYYKDSMSGNLTPNLGSLVKSKRINQIAKNTYALSAAERAKLEAKVADIG